MAVIIDGSSAKETLSWTDSFIAGLLTEEEKYQDVIKDLSTEAIASTVRRLDYASEQYLAGAEILQNRATTSTSHALVVIDEEVDDEILPVLPTITPPPPIVNTWVDENDFNARLAALAAQYNATLGIDEKLLGLYDYLDAMARGWGVDLDKMQQDLGSIQKDFPGFIAEQTVGLLAIPFTFLFDRFMDAFFEEE